MLAEIRVQSGRIAEAYQLIEQTLSALKGPNIGFYLPRLLRLRNDCLASLSPQGAADTSASLVTAMPLVKLHNDHLSALKAAIALSHPNNP